MDDIPSPPRDTSGLPPAVPSRSPSSAKEVDDEFSKSAALSVMTIGGGLLLTIPMVFVAFFAALVVPFGPAIWFALPIGLSVLVGLAFRAASRGNAGAAVVGAPRRRGITLLACGALVVTLCVWLVPVGIGQYLAASFL